MKISKRNHDKVRQPKLGYGYCSCDKTMVGKGSKCPLCKNKMKGSTRKSNSDDWEYEEQYGRLPQ